MKTKTLSPAVGRLIAVDLEFVRRIDDCALKIKHTHTAAYAHIFGDLAVQRNQANLFRRFFAHFRGRNIITSDWLTKVN